MRNKLVRIIIKKIIPVWTFFEWEKLGGSAELFSASSYEIRANEFPTFSIHTVLFSHILYPSKSLVQFFSFRESLQDFPQLYYIATGNYGYLKCSFYSDLKVKLFDHILVAQNFWKSVTEIFFYQVRNINLQSSHIKILICSYGMITLCFD